MSTPITRRRCLTILPTLSGAAVALGAQPRVFAQPSTTPSPAPSDSFPAQDPDLVRSIVGASHGNTEVVTDLLKKSPRLANAAWDWGFGDWETALGAASHTGRAAIAEMLLDHGARPDVFAFAMLGKVDAVKAMCEAQPGLQRVRGPHGISLMAHARVGGAAAAKVVEYLESLGGADDPLTDLPLSDEDRRAIEGAYSYGARPDQRFKVFTRERDNALMIQRGETAPRGLLHLGRLEFHPTGAPEVRVTFATKSGNAASVTITSPAPLVTARRV